MPHHDVPIHAPGSSTRPLTRREAIGEAAGASMCLFGSRFCTPPANSEEIPSIRALAEAYRAKYDVPGLSIAIARNERLVYVMGFGQADRASNLPVTPQSVFRIASISKPFTSVTLFKLMESGKLKLSDRIFGDGALLGHDFGAPPYGPGIDAITVEHLMTHTSGGWPNDGRDPMFRHPEMNHHELITWTLANQPLDHPPGQSFAYSNFGYCILGRVVEKLTGKPYHEAVQSLVMKPCGIKTMRISGNTEQERAPGEVSYYARNDGNPYGMQVARMDSHGGWLATPTDLVRFATCVDGFPERRDILRQSTEKTMVTPSAVNAGYAHGWMVNRANNYWHNGSLPGTAGIMVRTSRDMCWAALTNARRPGTKMEADLDALMWNMVNSVDIWPADDLFAENSR